MTVQDFDLQVDKERSIEVLEACQYSNSLEALTRVYAENLMKGIPLPSLISNMLWVSFAKGFSQGLAYAEKEQLERLEKL